MEKALLPLTITSDPRPFNQQLPEPPDVRCVLEPQDGLELAPALVCALCCCFGIIYCCFGEGRAWGAAAQDCCPQEWCQLSCLFRPFHLCQSFPYCLCQPLVSVICLSFVSYFKIPFPVVLPTRDFNFPQNLSQSVVIWTLSFFLSTMSSTSCFLHLPLCF